MAVPGVPLAITSFIYWLQISCIYKERMLRIEKKVFVDIDGAVIKMIAGWSFKA